MEENKKENKRKVALIAGGSGAIGSATALMLAKRGYLIALHGSTKAKVDAVVEKCNEISGQKVG